MGAKSKYAKISVKTWVIERCIELIDNGEIDIARECLCRISDTEYRVRDRKEKERLYWNMRHSSNDIEFAENKKLYDEFMENSFL